MAKCGNILMNTSAIANGVTRQRHRYYSKFSMKFPLITNVFMMQRRRCCTFDSPGLASESVGYPGSFAISENNAVGVVPFIPRHFITTFHEEKAQHLRR